MDRSICTGPVLQLLPQTVNVRVDAPLSQKMMRRSQHLSHTISNLI